CKQEASSTLAGLCKAAEESGQLVYDNAPGSEKYFLHSRVGGTTIPNKPFYNVQSADDHTLVFESRFESGNLKRAIKVGPYEYQLWMRTDMYTVKHTQWFFFRVRNTKAAITYRFHIMNFIKSNSLYNDGMQPLMYSEMDAYKNKTGWVRTGINIKYYKNEIRREDTTKDRYHYTLTWSCQFQYNRDTCYFAHCYPYTYSDLQEYLAVIRNDPIKTRLCKQRVLCRTLCGNFVHILTITNPSRRPADAEAKRAVVITARVHPGETNSSWMMKGLLDFLTSNNPDAKLLRDTFVFKIVPMINPDGVIVGNYRCSLTGRDLNRNYKTSLKDSFPPIWHIKNMVKKLIDLVFWVDNDDDRLIDLVFWVDNDDDRLIDLVFWVDNDDDRLIDLVFWVDNDDDRFIDLVFWVDNDDDRFIDLVFWVDNDDDRFIDLVFWVDNDDDRFIDLVFWVDNDDDRFIDLVFWVDNDDDRFIDLVFWVDNDDDRFIDLLFWVERLFCY
ncbi:cytosolic carboxypeptidase 2, partial [Exaiptasia diaphana]|uniref:Peptidase M14 domain-containing protein n=1 Tax=Exaiptasia diaphana TaxID=2652724 RepID=A0A913WUT9_EXADI